MSQKMENDNMHGHWTGIFSYDNGVTVIEFTEDVVAKKMIMKQFVRGVVNLFLKTIDSYVT